MSKLWKKIMGTVLGIVVVLGVYRFYATAMGADNTVTMTSFVADEEAKKAAEGGAVVTISTLEEFRLFQKTLNERDDGFQGITFRQEADITPGDYHYTYDETMDKFQIYQGTQAVAAVGRNGTIYQKNGYSESSLESLGLSELMLQQWDEPLWFKGQYDGAGHSIGGFLLGDVDGKGSSCGGIFCNLSKGILTNINVSDCCMINCMAPLVNAVTEGSISDCHVSNIVGAGSCCGSIAGLLWEGSIQECTAKQCTYLFANGYGEGDPYGGLGGIVGIIEQNNGANIVDCEAADVVLYGLEYSQIGVGGIVGLAETSRNQDITVKDCRAQATIYGGKSAGGIIGKVQHDVSASSSASFLISDCQCSGSMRESEESGGSDFGGILGKLEQDVCNFQIENCISTVDIQKTSKKTRSMGTAGGIIGNGKADFLINSSFYAGTIRQEGVAGQSHSAGGIVGEVIAGGTMINCANFGKVSLEDRTNHVCGGLVGVISSDLDVDIENNINLGATTGHVAGGLVGMIEESGASHSLHNNLSLGQIAGDTLGGLAGEIHQGKVTYCYWFQNGIESFGNEYSEIQNCVQVTAKQLAGTEKECPVFGTGIYQEIYELKEVLNRQASITEKRNTYSLWENTEAGYPFFDGIESTLPFSLPILSLETGEEPVSPTATPMGSEATAPPAGTDASAKPGDTTPTPAGNESTATPAGNESTATPAGNESTATPSDNESTDSPAGTGSSTEQTGTAGLLENEKETITAVGFQAESAGSKCVRLTWKKNTFVDGYLIHRSVKKASGYQALEKCNSKITSYVDKTCKPGKKYYYQIRAYVQKDGNVYLGTPVVEGVRLPWLQKPVYRMSREKGSQGEKYLQISMEKYQGKYVDIYLKKQNGSFRKVSMRTHKISDYQGNIRFIYRKSGITYRCKLRTYRIKNGKKQYSAYSAVQKIQL